MIYVPVAVFVLVVAFVAISARYGVGSFRTLAQAGVVGLLSAVASAYLIQDRSDKGFPDVPGIAAALLIAHGVLFVALLLTKPADERPDTADPRT